ncbi:uncharacterized protein LOC114128982 [Aphis gossypii]|uniref:uncharacterized protein LOC114128982 n=1 Tax=Aphis gossypii TaxID=80765 RepID=UPI002158ACF2|nr:uncharacterized protein LOC114128982 [Aphis gossypii]XP_050058783.1 uncharacterized protein LOC114128982 [Aphis gossypii]XP_050058788.1 uncharacterized protein LOC114128982 [Aphis gossypii]XP_050058794.1 uncharacterized protein LOC114128982 [Aphis gossypii]
MNSTETALEHTEISEDADWALVDIANSINATGLLAEDLEEYGGLTEVQTLILACVATVIPLFLGLLLVLGVRMVWKKYKNHNTNSGYDNDGLRREDSCDAVKSSSFMQSAEELKTSESQYSVLMPDDAASTAVCCYAAANGASAPLPPLLYNSPPNNRFGDTNKTNLNGSIITLTMKNNHLIVETEERVPGVCMASSAGEVAAAATAAAAVAEAEAKSMDYEYDDDEFDMEAEMLRREFREASLLANGGGGGAACGPTTVAVDPAVLEPSSQTQVDLTADRRPTASVAQLQVAAADHSSGGSSSVDSRVAEMAYAYGNQCEYTVEDVASKHGGKGPSIAVVKSAAAAASTATVNNNNNNNDEEYLVEQRLLGNGVDGGGGGHTDGDGDDLPPLPNADNCSPGDRGLATTAAAAATATVSQ